MRAVLAACLALCACGGGTKSDGGPSRQPGAGEGTTCEPSGGSCPDSLTCASWCAYQNPIWVCRPPCSAGCLSGESCGHDGTCQCSPTGAPGESDDSCASIGLVCHPDFRVCVETQTSTTCPAQLSYSKLWQLCRPPSC
ncbi:MAG: hypothetical protein ACYDCL_02675 [Myxococcales bacterium]